MSQTQDRHESFQPDWIAASDHLECFNPELASQAFNDLDDDDRWFAAHPNAPYRLRGLTQTERRACGLSPRSLALVIPDAESGRYLRYYRGGLAV